MGVLGLRKLLYFFNAWFAPMHELRFLLNIFRLLFCKFQGVIGIERANVTWDYGSD